MSASNGVIRIGRKGLKKFAFGEPDPKDPNKGVFEVDVVVAFQQWIVIDDQFRQVSEGEDRSIPTAEMPVYHQAAQEFVRGLGGGEVTVAEALDFIARLHEQWDELVVFFRPKLRQEPDLPDTSGAELRFSVEGTEPS